MRLTTFLALAACTFAGAAIGSAVTDHLWRRPHWVDGCTVRWLNGAKQTYRGPGVEAVCQVLAEELPKGKTPLGTVAPVDTP